MMAGGGGGNNPSEPFNPSCDDGEGGGGICDSDFPGDTNSSSNEGTSQNACTAKISDNENLLVPSVATQTTSQEYCEVADTPPTPPTLSNSEEELPSLTEAAKYLSVAELKDILWVIAEMDDAEEGMAELAKWKELSSQEDLREAMRLLQGEPKARQNAQGQDCYLLLHAWFRQLVAPAVPVSAVEVAETDFPKVGDRIWRKPVPAKKGKPFEPGIELVVTSLTPNGAFAESALNGDRYHISWHAWESGTFIPYQE